MLSVGLHDNEADVDDNVDKGLAEDHHRDEGRADQTAREVRTQLRPAELRPEHEGVPGELESAHGRG